MELVFKEELEELIDTLEELEECLKSIEREIEYEESCYGYEYDEYEYEEYEYEEIKKNVFIMYKDEFEDCKSKLKRLIHSNLKSIPEVFENNLFAIGKVRREEILTLLSKVLDHIDNLYYDDIILVDKIKNEISDYLSKEVKDLVNERKRQSRRNESGFTKREQEKQDKIESIYILKQQGLTQSQVRSKLKFSKGLISKYWHYVHSNGKWEICKRNIENKKDKIRKNSEELTIEGEELTIEDEELTLVDEALTP